MKPWMLWTVALAFTLTAAVYEYRANPAYPLRGERQILGEEIRYSLPRIHYVQGEVMVKFPAPEDLRGTIAWRRHPSEEAWTYTPMAREGRELVGRLPRGAALEYRVIVEMEDERLWLTGPPVVLRFEEPTAEWRFWARLIAMLGALLFAMRAVLETLAPGPVFWPHARLALVLTVAGSAASGFDKMHSLAAAAWVVAALALRWRWPTVWVMIAACATLAAYLRPQG
jgi:hypothetical protein